MNKESAENDNFQDENPYHAPTITQNTKQPWETPHLAYRGLVPQVKPLCICMMIQGVLEILTGVTWAGMAIFLPSVVFNQQGGAGAQIPEEQLPTIRAIVGGIYGVIAAVVVFVGVMRIVAGWRGIHFKSRRFGMTSHILGLLSFMSCYCLPTAIGLCVWGCIVYRKPEVKNAFMMGERGYSAAEIEAGVNS